MDEILVGLIVAGAIFFTIKSFVNIYQGKKKCDCGGGCSCPSKESCSVNPQLLDKK